MCPNPPALYIDSFPACLVSSCLAQPGLVLSSLISSCFVSSRLALSCLVLFFVVSFCPVICCFVFSLLLSYFVDWLVPQNSMGPHKASTLLPRKWSYFSSSSCLGLVVLALWSWSWSCHVLVKSEPNCLGLGLFLVNALPLLG